MSFTPATKEEMIKRLENERKRFEELGGLSAKMNLPAIDEQLDYWKNKWNRINYLIVKSVSARITPPLTYL